MSSRKEVSPSLLFGLGLAALFAALRWMYGERFALGLFALITGAHLLATCWLPWARLGLVRTTLGWALAGSTLSALGMALVLGEDALPFWIGLAVGGGLGAALLILIDGRSHPAEWSRWEEAVDDASLMDFLLCRHVPRMTRQ